MSKENLSMFMKRVPLFPTSRQFKGIIIHACIFPTLSLRRGSFINLDYYKSCLNCIYKNIYTAENIDKMFIDYESVFIFN